jgi:hypothetical protein
VTSSKDRWIGAYSIGPNFPGKLRCPIKKKVIKDLKTTVNFTIEVYNINIENVG